MAWFDIRKKLKGAYPEHEGEISTSSTVAEYITTKYFVSACRATACVSACRPTACVSACRPTACAHTMHNCY
eukprot:1158175-Pelagomonas_calceolata.AAC.2